MDARYGLRGSLGLGSADGVDLRVAWCSRVKLLYWRSAMVRAVTGAKPVYQPGKLSTSFTIINPSAPQELNMPSGREGEQQRRPDLPNGRGSQCTLIIHQGPKLHTHWLPRLQQWEQGRTEINWISCLYRGKKVCVAVWSVDPTWEGERLLEGDNRH